MTTRPSAVLRRQVIARAQQCCEYCLVPQDLVASTHQVDHVIAEKHGAQTVLENLALSCTLCNRRKASDLSSLDPDTGTLEPLFHPRRHPWTTHFRLEGAHILGRTPIGRTTVAFLAFNAPERLVEHAAWIQAGRYPPRPMPGDPYRDRREEHVLCGCGSAPGITGLRPQGCRETPCTAFAYTSPIRQDLPDISWEAHETRERAIGKGVGKHLFVGRFNWTMPCQRRHAG